MPRLLRLDGRQPKLVELRFTPFQAPDIAVRFPGVVDLDLGAELVAVSDAGDIYRGSQAWIICLHGLKEYREWARRLARPELLPLARQLCKLVSANRRGISRWLLKATPVELREKVAAAGPVSCGVSGGCK